MFHQKIPIKIPQGTHGMQPELALGYDPGLGSGIVGVGCQMTGLSLVTRVNFDNGVNYDGKDTYAHSTLGVLVLQPDGTYRSKNESFTRIEPSGTCGDGPCSWVATDRSGVKFFYGTTSDSQLMQYYDGPSVRTWALSKVLDLFGNSYEISYVNPNQGDREIYPHSIVYTNGPAYPSLRTILFDYEGRSDVERRASVSSIGTLTAPSTSTGQMAGCSALSIHGGESGESDLGRPMGSLWSVFATSCALLHRRKAQLRRGDGRL